MSKFIDWLLGPAPITASQPTIEYPAVVPAPTQLESPWVTSELAKVVFPDFTGITELPISRSEIMSVPAYKRARDIVCTTLARIDLEAVDSEGNQKLNSNSWFYATQPDPLQPRYQTILWTLDDILFYGCSWWVVIDRYSVDNRPRATRRITPGGVVIHDGGKVTVYGRETDPADLIRIDGPHEGLVALAGRSARAAASLEASAAKFAANPTPSVELHATEQNPMSADDIRDLIDSWANARLGANGGVAYTPHNIEVKLHGTPIENLLIAGRNQAAVDAARFVGLPADAIDAAPEKTSFTYANVSQKSQALIDYGLSAYASAIESRLSMSDVTPAGTLVRFRFDQLTAISDGNESTSPPPPEAPAKAAPNGN